MSEISTSARFPFSGQHMPKTRLDSGARPICSAKNSPQGMSPLNSTPVPSGRCIISFDNNIHDYSPNTKQGPEFADAVIWGEDGFVTIEAKANSDWKAEKDIWAEVENASEVASSTGLKHMAHVLILADQKWRNVRAPGAANKESSTWQGFKNDLEDRWAVGEKPPLVFLTWESLAQSAREHLGEEGAHFADWIAIQVPICMRSADQMPPTGG
jgi:hypothetical protein